VYKDTRRIDYLDKLNPEERDWLNKFDRAVTWGNKQDLRELCDAAGSKKYEELKVEIAYERGIGQRMVYTVNTQRKPRYTEWNYCWSQPIVEPNKRHTVDHQYYGSAVAPELFGDHLQERKEQIQREKERKRYVSSK